MKFAKKAILFFILILAFWTGIRVGERHAATDVSAAVNPVKIWTCSMHPQIRLSTQGKCPICGMDLIPLNSGAETSDNRKPVIELSPYAEALAEVRTMPVVRKFVSVEIRMVGKVAFDEYTMSYITARMPGRIDKLYVNYTGIAVKKGDHIAEVYSPDLLVAQQELLQSLKYLKASKPGDEFAGRILNAVKEKYRLWGFSDEQILEIIQRGTVSDHLTITAPISGIVIEKAVRQGQYYEKGEKLFAIADLNELWVKLDAYETDMPWIKYGQDIEFTVEACPGKTFKGKIAFIQPVLDEKTRTVKIRLDVNNRDGMLKPGMFVRAILRAEMAENGKVMNDALAGKWISPMHPDVIKDHPGYCDICGMPLVSAESLGFADKNDKNLKPPLVIPASAPLLTGKRAVVYISVPGKKGQYEGKEIRLGAKAGDFYIVEAGLNEGERVAVNGNFKIDSAVQIHGEPSMITDASPDIKPEAKVRKPVTDDLLASYFLIHDALYKDNLDAAVKNAEKLDTRYATKLSSAPDLKTAREIFYTISSLLYNDLKKGDAKQGKPLYKLFCPMAFDNKGAFWFQNDEKTRNPYFGPVMPSCGEVQERIGNDK